MMASKYALVLAASGISGWAIVRECLSYSSTASFTRVIALSNKPLEKTDFLLPEEAETEKLELYSGIDLSKGVDPTVKSLSDIPTSTK